MIHKAAKSTQIRIGYLCQTLKLVFFHKILIICVSVCPLAITLLIDQNKKEYFRIFFISLVQNISLNAFLLLMKKIMKIVLKWTKHYQTWLFVSDMENVFLNGKFSEIKKYFAGNILLGLPYSWHYYHLTSSGKSG